jgi:hypothetical protein
MKPFQRLAVLATLPLAAAAVAAVQSPEPDAPNRQRMVAGWQIEEVTEPDSFDGTPRVIVRMKRETERQSVEYALDAGSYYGEGTNGNAFLGLGHDSMSCSLGDMVHADDGDIAARARQSREGLAAQVAQIERNCEVAAGTMNGILDGFETAFAVAAGWYDERVAARNAAMEEAGVDSGNDVWTDGNYADENSVMMTDAEMNAMTDATYAVANMAGEEPQRH